MNIKDESADDLLYHYRMLVVCTLTCESKCEHHKPFSAWDIEQEIKRRMKEGDDRSWDDDDVSWDDDSWNDPENYITM